MVGRGKARQAPPKERLKEDGISQLDDPLICQILCHLPTKDAVRTSVLSTRWRTLWLWVPILELRSKDFPDSWVFVRFGNRFFDSDRVSCLDKVTLTIGDDDGGTSYLTSWIDAMVKRKIQHLDVSCPYEPPNHEMPLTLYSCKTLVYLKLALVSFKGAADLSKLSTSEFVSLPCLKTMHLELNSYPNEATFEGLISSCPVLEDLTVVVSLYNDVKVLRVLSSSLKRLCLEIVYMHRSGSGFVIDAPRLEILSLSAHYSTDIFILKNVDSIAELDMCVDFGLRAFDEARLSSKRDIIRSFLSRVSNVRDVTMRLHTFEVISEYSKLEPLPQFGCMSRLRLALDAFYFKCLPSFLKSCPNLKSLVLACEDNCMAMSFEEMNQISSFPYAPECLQSSLKSVDIKSCIWGEAAEMKLVSYFLENSVVLEKLTLRSGNLENENVIFKKLLAIPRRSIKCQVIVH